MQILRVDPLRPQEETLRKAGEVIRNGGLVIIPTETVYGIAASLLNDKTIDKLFRIKRRPLNKPFSLHIADKNKVSEFAVDIPAFAYRLIYKLMPGPITLVLKAKDNKGTIGIRMPDHLVALKVIAYAQVPVVCPSANLSGKPAPQKFSDAIKDLDNLVDLALDCGDTKLGKESTVIDCTDREPKILREGAVEKSLIEEIVRKKTVLFVCTGNSCRSVMAGALLEKRLKENNRTDIEVQTAGMLGLTGLGATQEVKDLLSREGIDVSKHMSKQITKEMLRQSDLILVMEKIHEERIMQIVPEVKNRLFLLKEFAKIKDNNLDIPDPIGRPKEFYEETFLVIKEAVEKVSQII